MARTKAAAPSSRFALLSICTYILFIVGSSPPCLFVCFGFVLTVVSPTTTSRRSNQATNVRLRDHAGVLSFSGAAPQPEDRHLPAPTGTTTHKNSLSLDECLQLFYQQQQQQQQQNTTTASSACGGVVRFVDGSWFHKGPRQGRAAFRQGPRIAGAVYFDLDDISCSAELFPELNPANLSHMQPPPHLFAAYMDACGITNRDVVILYGQAGCAFLPRVWFTFRHVMGHDRVHLMQGSLQEWIEHGGPVVEGVASEADMVGWAKDLDLSVPTRYQVQNYYQHSNRNNQLIVSRHEIKAMLQQQVAVEDTAADAPVDNQNQRILILDPRGSSFAQQGHMPGAIHVPYTSLSEPHNPNRLKSLPALRSLLRDAVAVMIHPENNNDSIERRIVLSCGSGVSVCNLYLALEECGYTSRVSTVVYDGSWEEWSRYDDLPKALPTAAAAAAASDIASKQ